MQNLNNKTNKSGIGAATLVFIGIFVFTMIIALLNAPTMGGPRVMASVSTYLEEVRQTPYPL